MSEDQLSRQISNWTAVGSLMVAIGSLVISIGLAVYSTSVQLENLRVSSEAALRANCFTYVDFVLTQQAQGMADTQIDRTTDLLTTVRGEKQSLTILCGNASEIRLARERNTPLPGFEDNK